MLRKSLLLAISAGLPFILASYSAMAQTPDPVMAAQAPMPGSGHNYLGLATETVNPADGSLTFDLPLPLPPGRGISLPFSIHYDSGLMYYLSPYQSINSTFPKLNWTPAPRSNADFMLPFLSFQPLIHQSGYQVSGNEGQTYTYYQCNWITDFVFRGLDGVQYPLGQVGEIWSNTDDYPSDQPDPNCTYSHATSGTYHGILITPGAQDPNLAYGQPATTLTDASGTVYSFNAFPVGQIPTYASLLWSPTILLPQTITDRNGNQITLQNPGNNQVAYQDTLGRNVVTWGSGNISVSGFGSVSIVSSGPQIALTFPGTITDTGHTNLPCTKNPTQPNATSISQNTVITLPNNKTYTLTLDPSFGQINKIEYPEGGSITYIWGVNTNSSSGSAMYTFSNPVTGQVVQEGCSYEFDTPAISQRVVNDGTQNILQQNFYYTTNWNPAPLEPWIKTTKVVTEDLIAGTASITTYTYGPIQADIYNSSSWLSASVPVERSISYKDCGTNPVVNQDCTGGMYLKVVNKTWGDVRHMIGEQTILSNNQGSAKQYCYDGNEQLTDVYEYSFQQEGTKPADLQCYTNAFNLGSGVEKDPGLTNSQIGPLMRHTVTALHNFVGASPSTHIVNEPDSVATFDGSAKQQKLTSFAYDGSAIVNSNPATATGHVSPPALRGNVTSTTHWLNGGTSPVTSYTYYETGQLASSTSACTAANCPDLKASNFTTSYSYTDSPSGGNAPGNSNAYLTTITDPAGHTRGFSYSYPSGKPVSSTDNNMKKTSYNYGTQAADCSTTDQLDRLTEIDYPDGGVTSYCYNDSTPSVTTNQKLGGSSWKTTVSTMDGLGHAVQVLDPSGSTTQTVYGGLGQVYSVYNPTRCSPATSNCGEPTWAVTSFQYDALGRKTLQTDSDGSSKQHWSYNGNITNITDENNNVWQRASDGLGRLKQVVEPNGAATYYTYDTLDDLTCAAQDGGTGATFTSCSAVSASWRPRTFTYDSLSRLITATNPETGTLCYGTLSGGSCSSGYDANGNLASKTDARGVVTSYTYDGLNRLLSKTYAGTSAATLSSCYQYDTAGNGIGRLGAEWTQNGSCPSPPALPANLQTPERIIDAYDVMGRVASEQQCVAGYCTSGSSPASPTPNCTSLGSAVGLQYCYDLAGDLLAYSNGVTTSAAGTYTQHAVLFSQTFDGAGRLASVGSSWNDTTHPSPLFSNTTYAPQGGLSSWLLGAKLWTSRQYDNRLRVCNQQSALQSATAPNCP